MPEMREVLKRLAREMRAHYPEPGKGYRTAYDSGRYDGISMCLRIVSDALRDLATIRRDVGASPPIGSAEAPETDAAPSIDPGWMPYRTVSLIEPMPKSKRMRGLP